MTKLAAAELANERPRPDPASRPVWTAQDSLLAALMVLLITLLLAPAMGSGFHLTDDHEIISLNSQLHRPNASVVGVAMEAVERDMFRTHRLRPVYYVSRVAEVRLLGTNFLRWSILTYLLAVAAAMALYWAGRLAGFTELQAGVFVALSLAGPQAVIWWALGPAETGGAFFLALALLFCFLAAASGGKRLPDIAFFLTATCASLFKESFVLVIPALVFLRLWFDKSGTWPTSLRKNRLLIAALSVVFFAEILLLIAVVGIGGVGYAGVDSNSLSMFAMVRTLLQLRVLLFTAVGLAGMALLRWYYGGRQGTNFLVGATLFACLWVGPQIVLYAKSGMASRYLIPASVGIAFFSVYLLRFLRQNEKADPRATALFAGPDVHAMIVVLLAIMLFAPSRAAYLESLRFGLEGRALNSMLSNVRRATAKRDSIVIVADPAANYEWSISLKRYLNLALDRDQVYLLPVHTREYSDFEAGLANRIVNGPDFAGAVLPGDVKLKPEAKVLILFDGLEGGFIANSGKLFRPALYTRVQYQENFSIAHRAVEGVRFVTYLRHSATDSVR